MHYCVYKVNWYPAGHGEQGPEIVRPTNMVTFRIFDNLEDKKGFEELFEDRYEFIEKVTDVCGYNLLKQKYDDYIWFQKTFRYPKKVKNHI